MKNDECMKERSQIAKNEFNEGKSILADQVKLAGKNEMSYDNMITDITELFLSGEAVARNPETVGSSSRSLTVLFWNLGNWQRGINFRVPSDLEYQNLFYKEERPDTYPDHVPENNNLFLQMIKNLRAHIVLNCEATTLLPFREYLEKHHWTLCFNDATDLCCLARAGLGGQIGGPNGRHKMTYGMVQNVVFHLPFLILSGARLSLVVLMQLQQVVISLVKILKIMKKCAALE